MGLSYSFAIELQSVDWFLVQIASGFYEICVRNWQKSHETLVAKTGYLKARINPASAVKSQHDEMSSNIEV